MAQSANGPQNDSPLTLQSVSQLTHCFIIPLLIPGHEPLNASSDHIAQLVVGGLSNAHPWSQLVEHVP